MHPVVSPLLYMVNTTVGLGLVHDADVRKHCCTVASRRLPGLSWRAAPPTTGLAKADGAGPALAACAAPAPTMTMAANAAAQAQPRTRTRPRIRSRRRATPEIVTPDLPTVI